MPEITCSNFSEWSFPNQFSAGNVSTPGEEQVLPECFAVTVTVGIKNQGDPVAVRVMCCTGDYYGEHSGDFNDRMPFILDTGSTTSNFKTLLQRECDGFECPDRNIQELYVALAEHLGGSIRSI